MWISDDEPRCRGCGMPLDTTLNGGGCCCSPKAGWTVPSVGADTTSNLPATAEPVRTGEEES